MKFHKLERSRDKQFWSVRVSRDIRLIVHRTDESLMLCYVDHHDEAYRWAENRRLKRHPKTGAAQLVEVREATEIINIPVYVEATQPKPASEPLFSDTSDDELLRYGIPEDWMAAVRAILNADDLLALVDHLPAEAAEALLELATGGQPEPPVIQPDGADAFEHPDAQRRFRTLRDVEELERALEYPWDKWAVFLHPAQREWVEKEYGGPARVSGSAGTGKTIVALHRAVHLASTHPEARVLLTTFSDTLANMLRARLHRLVSHRPRLSERIDVEAMDAVAQRLHRANLGAFRLVADDELDALLASAADSHGDHGFSTPFLRSEWREVVDAWQLTSWEEYQNVRRLGRKTRLPEGRRRALWEIYESVRRALRHNGWITSAELFAHLTKNVAQRQHTPYDFAVLDEAQDVSVAQLRFLAELGKRRPDALFFAGDLGQRIFRQPFSWRSLGVDIRGRSRTLHVNYRTSHQIRFQADKLLDPDIADVDGHIEERSSTVSVFNGPAPAIIKFPSSEKESEAVTGWLRHRLRDGMKPEELAVFVRSGEQMERATRTVMLAGLDSQKLGESVRVEPGKVVVSTMHLAKGMEFRAVVVMACDDEVIPSQRRIEAIVDEADLEEVYNTERHLLYVACTRARDQLWVSGVSPVSEFLEDMAESVTG